MNGKSRVKRFERCSRRKTCNNVNQLLGEGGKYSTMEGRHYEWRCFARTDWGLHLDMFSRPDTTDKERLTEYKLPKERPLKLKEEVNRWV